MFVPEALDARSAQVGPQACRPFSIHSNVCVGDMISIIACSVAGVGFFFWSIHAIRKMRQPSPFDEDKDYLNVDDPYRAAFDISHLTDENGVIQKPDYADRVRIRLALSAPDDPLDKPSDPDSTDPDEQDWVITKPCIPPYAAGQSQRASSHHSSHHLLPMRGGPYGESDTPDVFIMPDEHIRNVGPSRKNSLCHPSCHASPLRGGPYGERYEYGVNSGANDEHMRNTAPSRKISSCRSSHVPPTQGGPYGAGYQYDEYIASVNDSRARGEPLHRSGTGHGYYQSVRRTNGDPVTYAYA